jgi:hypothetical protein
VRQRLAAYRSHLPVSWSTVAVFAIVIAYVDGFWVTSLQGAVGAIERNQPPFERWLHDSTLMVPMLFLAVLAALAVTRRWVGQSRREVVKLAAAALLIIGISSFVSIAEVTASSAYDYHLQTRHLGQLHSVHVHPVAIEVGTVAISGTGTCIAACAVQHDTLVTHVRAVGYASVVLLITNLVVVIWVLAVRGGRLWARQAEAPPMVNEPSSWGIPAGV